MLNFMLSENVAFTVLIRLRPAKSKYKRKNSFKRKTKLTKEKMCYFQHMQKSNIFNILT